MDPAIFVAIVIGFFLVIGAASLMGDSAGAFKGPHRFVVRQQDDGATREWICAQYVVSDGRIYFYQEGHKERTIVAGNWHIEPVAVSKD